MKNKITIIVPVYNREKEVARCMDSIRKQEYSNFECILIDDGSTDSSLDIMNRYAIEDERFIVLHKDNGGVSSARNLGLETATGDWVVFVDSDDEILPSHLTSYMDSLDSWTDLYFCGYVDNLGDYEKIHQYGDMEYVGIGGINEFLCNTDVFLCMPICDKMYRRSIIEKYNIRFDTTLNLSEDRLFTYEYLLHSDKIKTISSISYIVHAYKTADRLTHNKLSLMCKINRYKKLQGLFERLNSRYELLQNGCFMAWEYHWTLFLSVIESMSDEGCGILEKTRMQHDFWKSNFNVELYNQVRHVQKIAVMMNSYSNRTCVRGCFFMYNLKRLIWSLWD